jgi:TonB family protein
MTAAVATYRIFDLPWSTGEEQEREFRRKLGTTGGTVLFVALILWFLPVPEQAELVEEIPPRLARLVMEQQRLPPPPPPVVREEAPPEEIVEPEPVPVVEERVEAPPSPVVVEPPPAPVDTVQQARERASVAGLLPFAQELAALRDNDSVDRLNQADLVATAGAGGAGAPGPGAAAVTERSLITSRVGTASGGINTATLSRNTGGAGLTGRTTTQVESPVAEIGDGGVAAQASGGDDGRASRSREEIERVFDRNKGAIYALYNRALRENPALEGKVVLRLTISPDGVVTACEIVSSELGDPDLEQKLVQRVLLFQFEARDVDTITTTKPIDFFPA